MIGLGTIINTVAVIVGGFIGMGLKNGLKKNVQDILMQACGVATIFIGASGTLAKMLVIENNNISVFICRRICQCFFDYMCRCYGNCGINSRWD